MAPRIAVIFYTTYGTNHAVAEEAKRAAEEAGADVKLFRVKETAPEEVVNSQDAWKEQLEKMQDIPVVTPEDMEWADGYFFAAPTRYGVVASQVRAFIDTLGPVWQKGGLADKTFTATTSAGNEHGGQEGTIQSLYTTAYHWGSIVVAPGYTSEAVGNAGGNPYGFSKTAGSPLSDSDKAAIAHQAKRLVDMTGRIARRDESVEAAA